MNKDKIDLTNMSAAEFAEFIQKTAGDFFVYWKINQSEAENSSDAEFWPDRMHITDWLEQFDMFTEDMLDGTD